ncbi:hypothetical protein CBL_07611 [Carabus blaptoides fortunei]
MQLKTSINMEVVGKYGVGLQLFVLEQLCTSDVSGSLFRETRFPSEIPQEGRFERCTSKQAIRLPAPISPLVYDLPASRAVSVLSRLEGFGIIVTETYAYTSIPVVNLRTNTPGTEPI